MLAHSTNVNLVSVFLLVLAKVIIMLRQGENQETNCRDVKWQIPTKNLEIIKCNWKRELRDG